MKITKKFIAAAVTLAIAGQTGAIAMAKDVAPSPSTVPVVSGPCNVDLSDSTTGRIWYAVTNDRFPGAVAADMSVASGAIVLQAVCLEPGWSYTRQSASNGVQLRFFYNGERAIDFKFVSGKTDIRGY